MGIDAGIGLTIDAGNDIGHGPGHGKGPKERRKERLPRWGNPRRAALAGALAVMLLGALAQGAAGGDTDSEVGGDDRAPDTTSARSEKLHRTEPGNLRGEAEEKTCRHSLRETGPGAGTDREGSAAVWINWTNGEVRTETTSEGKGASAAHRPA